MTQTVETKQSPLDILLNRMRKDKDFPTLSESISSISHLTSKEDISVTDLANAILADFSVTNKLLRLVNSAYYGQFGEKISTISRAIAVLGFEQVRNAATSLLLFESLKNKAQAGELLDAVYSAMFSGAIAKELAAQADIDEEEARICSMFHNLGKLLVLFYFSNESTRIRDLEVKEGFSTKRACYAVLGLSYEELGVGVAKMWKFPDNMALSMREAPAVIAEESRSEEDKLMILSTFSNEICNAVIRTDAQDRNKELKKLSSRFKKCYDLSEKQITETLEASIKEVSSNSGMFDRRMQRSRFFRKVRIWSGSVTDKEASEDTYEEFGDYEATSAESESSIDSKSVFLKGLQEITKTLLSSFAMDDVFRMILETMYRALNFSHVLLCVKEPDNQIVGARFGFGQNIDRLIKLFGIPLNNSGDIFTKAFVERQDLIINNISATDAKQSMPFWHRRLIGAESIVILPIVVDKVNLGLLYADYIRGGSVKVISEEDQMYLKLLRDQAVLAIKQRK